MALQHLLSCRAKTDRHECTIVRRIGLANRNEGDSFAHQTCGDVEQRLLVRHAQHDCVRARIEVSRTTFSRCVYDLSGLQPYGEISSDDDVMADGIVIAAVGRITVVETSCSQAYP